MKEANLIAIEELQGLINIIGCYKMIPTANTDTDYIQGNNDALHMVETYVSRRIETLQKEVQI